MRFVILDGGHYANTAFIQYVHCLFFTQLKSLLCKKYSFQRNHLNMQNETVTRPDFGYKLLTTICMINAIVTVRNNGFTYSFFNFRAK